MRRMRRILDAKYEKADLNTVMAKHCKHLNPAQRCRLLTLLGKFEDLFDGALDMRNTTLVDLELKDNANSVCLQPYTVPRVHGAMLKKEAKRLVKLGVLDHSNDSKWGVPLFDQPKAKNEPSNIIKWFSEPK